MWCGVQRCLRALTGQELSCVCYCCDTHELGGALTDGIRRSEIRITSEGATLRSTVSLKSDFAVLHTSKDVQVHLMLSLIFRVRIAIEADKCRRLWRTAARHTTWWIILTDASGQKAPSPRSNSSQLQNSSPKVREAARSNILRITPHQTLSSTMNSCAAAP
ncbi:hypothetical protein FA95DRAFT_1407256 [Auriscalpium vulgare]|uniref:Uncharacterized protein n=1 Tax=Auriscalpium vulgare TaxID=40419 RepID=A0ACB8RRQ5_9AGAM|nr:hypothetical protein FA95DRAFT_1407256 [Auriscalpium vulgare]